MSYYMYQGSSLVNLSLDELKDLLQDDFKLDERVKESVRIFICDYVIRHRPSLVDFKGFPIIGSPQPLIDLILFLQSFRQRSWNSKRSS